MSSALKSVDKASPRCAERGGSVPLLVGTVVAACLHGLMPPWALMWVLAITVFVGFKFWTWWRAIHNGVTTRATRSTAYLFFWPGMDARRFLSLKPQNPRPPLRSLIWITAKIAFGAALMWGVARLAGEGLAAGWTGMVGFIFMLHFGLFAALALLWQRLGINAPP